MGSGTVLFCNFSAGVGDSGMDPLVPPSRSAQVGCKKLERSATICSFVDLFSVCVIFVTPNLRNLYLLKSNI